MGESKKRLVRAAKIIHVFCVCMCGFTVDSNLLNLYHSICLHLCVLNMINDQQSSICPCMHT